VLLAGRRRRHRWDDALATERTQAQWVIDQLVPAVTATSTPASAAAVHWAGAQGTLDQLDAGLAALVAAPPDAERLEAARSIGAALGTLRQAVDTDLGLRTGTAGIPADPAALATSAAHVRTARDRLAAAIATPA
jgi:hypothetical protein